MDTNRWLGLRHLVAREAGAAGYRLGVARGGERLGVNQIGQVVDLYPTFVQTAAQSKPPNGRGQRPGPMDLSELRDWFTTRVLAAAPESIDHFGSPTR